MFRKRQFDQATPCSAPEVAAGSDDLPCVDDIYLVLVHVQGRVVRLEARTRSSCEYDSVESEATRSMTPKERAQTGFTTIVLRFRNTGQVGN